MAEQKETLSDRVRNLSCKLSTIKSYFEPEGMTIQNDLGAILGAGMFIGEMIKETISLEDDLYVLENPQA